MTNQTHRVLELLKRFNNNQKVCIDNLRNEFLWEGKSEKTIRRDLNIIKAIFPESFELIRAEKGCYKAITKQAFENFMKPNTLSLMVQTFSMAQHSNLFENINIDDIDKSIIESKVKELKKIYEFKSKPFENNSANYEIYKKLENAIYHQKQIIIEYQVFDKIVEVEIKPYKIVFMNENFYLASEVDHEDYIFTLFRISKIQNATYANKTFHQNLDIVNFIKSMQTPLAKYTPNFRENSVEVTVEIDHLKAAHFKAKKHLPSQQFIEEKENGNHIFKFTVTQELEIEELVKRWLPYMKVISPLSLKDKITKDLSNYLMK